MAMTSVPVAGDRLQLSRIVLGGHEYLPDGRSRAFNEDLALAVTPGHVFPGFGGPLRLSVLKRALELGITAFDVTIDSEKEALGRNLREVGAPSSSVIQTRPEGMVYSYDPGNRKMIRPGLLRDEVRRLLDLLQREQLDILNLGVLREAFVCTPDFAQRLSDVVLALKDEGLIRCAAADTFSGEAVYLALIGQGAFETINLNFNLADDAALATLLPAAQAAGVRVVVREVFIKGELFRIAQDEGIADSATVARAAMRWAASQPGVDALIIGARSPEELDAGLAAAQDTRLPATERDVLDRLLHSPRLLALRAKNRTAFLAPLSTS